MKKMLVVLACLLALATGATAQTQQINFANLPLIALPAPVPLSYGGLNWSNFWYADPSEYDDAGPGYQNPFTHSDVAFIGGQYCGPVRPACYGVITSVGGTFSPSGAVMAAGYQANQITVVAYRQGVFVGSASYRLSTTPQVVGFPPSWGAITEMQIQTDEAGDLVLFDLIMYPTVQ